MKKTLLFSAAALLMASSMSAELSWKAETVWQNGVVNGVAKSIPGIDGGKDKSYWSPEQKTDPNYKCTLSNSRYAVGRDGKIYTISDIENAIVSWDGSKLEVFSKIPSRKEGRWNGTAINFDDAGNLVYNYNFTKLGSVTDWGVIKAGTKEQYDITVTGDVSSIGTRCDIIGHIVGDVTKEAYAFATFENSGNVGMFTFTGDGAKTTKLELKSVQTVDLLAKVVTSTPSIVVCPSETTLEKFKAAGVIPMDHRFYFPVGVNGTVGAGQVGVTDGYIARWDINPDNNQPVFSTDKMPMGNRGYVGIADFTLGGKTYIVRNYVSEEFLNAHPGLYTSNWTNVMNFGIYDAETGELVADWMGSEYGNSMGMGMLSAEVVDDNTVNIYTYATTSQDGGAGYNTAMGCYAAMVKFTVSEVQGSDLLEGKGTAASPYLIQSVEDLCNAHKLIIQDEASDRVYFKQTVDLDMTGITNYEALNGWKGGYNGNQYYGHFDYDGDNHVIRNFAPVEQSPVDDKGGYYSATLFGVASGSIKNLGVIDCNIQNATQGSGGLGGYGGHSTTGGITVDNVFVTGKIRSTSYAGGFFGTTSSSATIKNSYAAVDVDGSYAGGFMGRLQTGTLSIGNSYVLANVPNVESNGIIAGTKNAGGTVNVTNVVAIGTSRVTATGIGFDPDKTDGYFEQYPMLNEAALEDIHSFVSFEQKKELAVKAFDNASYPTLNWYKAPAVEDGKTAETAYLIYTKEDLMNAWKLTVNGQKVYFKQMEDIDMAGESTFNAIAGWDGLPASTYTQQIDYDGDNHVIRNFAPVAQQAVDGVGGYYSSTIFGVAAGSIRNLGVIDCDIKDSKQGAGGLAAYGGYSSTSDIVVDNVFVTGKLNCPGQYTGGFFGTTSKSATITNSYAVVDVNGSFAGGFMGRLQSGAMTVENSYVLANVPNVETNGIIAGTRDAGGTVTVKNVVAIGTSRVMATGINFEPNSGDGYFEQYPMLNEAALEDIYSFVPFEQKKELAVKAFDNSKYPTLNWMTEDQLSGVDDVIADEIEDNDAPVEYFNLQGVRVENPSTGLYIKRQGNKVTKVIIR